jgi:hypothetical protein
MAPLRLGEILCLGSAGAELDRDITVPIGLTASNYLNIFECQDGDGHVAAVLLNKRVIPIFFAITPVRMTMLLIQRHPGQFRGA